MAEVVSDIRHRTRGAATHTHTHTGRSIALPSTPTPLHGAGEWVHLHVGGLFSCPKLQPQLGLLIQLLRSVTDARVTVSLDTNCSATPEWGGPEMEGLLRACDLFFPNEEEAVGIAQACGLPPGADYEAAAVFLGSFTRIATVCTAGAQGVVIAEQGQPPQKIPPLEGAIAVDPTGCGDAFDAGFLHAWLQGAELKEAATWACCVAAKCLGEVGANTGAGPARAVQDFVLATDTRGQLAAQQSNEELS